MPRYTVGWRKSARDELTELWLRADDRRAVTNAVDSIESMLQMRPEILGEDFYGDRLLVLPPIHVVFTVSVDDRMVVVERVWQAK